MRPRFEVAEVPQAAAVAGAEPEPETPEASEASEASASSGAEASVEDGEAQKACEETGLEKTGRGNAGGPLPAAAQYRSGTYMCWGTGLRVYSGLRVRSGSTMAGCSISS